VFGPKTKATYDANEVFRRAAYLDKLTLYTGKKGIKDYVFQRGMVDLPDELSLHNFVETYSKAWMTGSPCTTQSDPMKMFGSMVGATKPRIHYHFWKEKKQRFSMFPRNYVMYHVRVDMEKPLSN
jgi:hypothetical protein